jgi:predicted phage tail protein
VYSTVSTVPTTATGSATVTWTAPASNNAAILSYRIRYVHMETSAAASTVSTDVAGTTLSLEVTGLTVAEHYTFQVFATNAAGEGTGSSATGSIFIDPAIPGEPTALTAVAASPSSIDISWTAPVSPGHVVTSYVVEQSSNSGTTYTAISGTVAGTAVTATGLSEGTSYLFRVQSVNQSGE